MEEVFSGAGIVVFRTKNGITVRLEADPKVSVHVNSAGGALTVRPSRSDELAIKVIAGVAVAQVRQKK